MKFILLLHFLAATLSVAALEPIGIDFFAKVKQISNLKVWDDKIFFTVSQADTAKNNYQTDLWQLVGDSAIRIARNVSEYDFLDGGIIFRSREDAAEKPSQEERQTVFQKLNYGFGGAEEWLRLPFTVAQIEWIDRERFFFTAPFLKNKDKNRNYHVYDELPFWSNGRGDVSGHRSNLYFYEKGEKRLLTDSLASVSGIKLSPDRKTLVYTLKPAYTGKQPEGNRLVALNVATLAKTEFDFFPRATYGGATFINNDEIALTINRSSEHDRIENPAIYRLNIKTGALTEIYDGSIWAIGNSIGTDIGGGGRAEPTFDRSGIRFVTTDVDYAPLVHLAWENAKITYLTKNRLTVQDYKPYKDGFLAIALQDQQGAELYFIDSKGASRPLTALNKPVFEKYNIVKPIEIQFQNNARQTLTGYVLPPSNLEHGKHYPAILAIHGGPKTAYGTVFFHEMQYWANRGFAVFFTNPRGSSGRGSAFSDIRGHVGDADYADLIAFTDAVLQQTDFIDSTRLGVTGGSYGGLMTNWIVGQTDRFRAAASQRGISSWLSFSNTSDIGYTYTYSYWGSDIWKDVETLWNGSPLKYADRVKTPTLFIHSAQDYRCWLVEGIQFYYALQYFGVPSRIVVFENENHELSRSGKPSNRIKRLDEITRWFERYLKE